jgi:hypothetical protein
LKQTRFDFVSQFQSVKFIYKIQNGHLNFLLMRIRHKLDAGAKIGDEAEHKKRMAHFKSVLQSYLEFNNDVHFYGAVYSDSTVQQDYQYRWSFWIRKLMQHGLLTEILDIIPTKTSAPGRAGADKEKKVSFELEISTYTKILEHLIKVKKVEEFQWCLDNLASHLINS